MIFKDLCNYFHKNEPFTKCQSVFLPGDYWRFTVIIVIIYCSVYQLFTSTLHCDPMQDVRGMILDISKAFDKVWHEGLLYNLET